MLLKKIYWHLRQLYWHILVKFYPENSFYKFNLPNNIKFYYPLNSIIGKHLFIGWFEFMEQKFVFDTLKKGDIVFDIGANGGLYTLISSNKVGNTGHIYAFEPSPREVEMLQYNIKKNKLENITVVQKAVSNQDGVALFNFASDSALNSLVETSQLQMTSQAQVQTIKIDTALNTYKIPYLNFIKIDVEGAEKMVFEGAEQLLKEQKEITILFEATDMTEDASLTKKLLNSLALIPNVTIHQFHPKRGLEPLDTKINLAQEHVHNFVLTKNIT